METLQLGLPAAVRWKEVVMTKVFVADDHHLFRQELVEFVKSDGLYNVVGEASDGQEALKKIRKINPDVAILNVSMPKITGIDVVRRVKKVNDAVQFILLTMREEEEFLSEALDAGVKGYILKENTTDDLTAALRVVSIGGSYISPIISSGLITRAENKRRFLYNELSINELTVKERKVLKLLSKTKTSKEIAEELNLSFRTVQNHRLIICKKLGLFGTNSLFRFAIENKNNL